MPKGRAEREERDRTLAERASPARAADRPLPLVDLGLHEPIVHPLESCRPRERVRDRQRHAERQIRTGRDRGHPRLRGPDRRGAILLEEPAESAECQLVAEARVEGGEIEGRGARESRAHVHRTHFGEESPDPAAVSQELAYPAREIQRRAQLVGPRVVEGLRQDEGTAVAIGSHRLAARESPGEKEAAVAQETRTEPRGDGRGERKGGDERPIALDAYRDTQQELPLAVREPSERRGIGVDPEVSRAREVTAQVEHAERLPREPRRIAPEVGQRQCRLKEGVVASSDRARGTPWNSIRRD